MGWAPMAKDVAFAFRCDECEFQRRMDSFDDDPTTSSGGCPCCGGDRWHIYAKDENGKVRVVV